MVKTSPGYTENRGRITVTLSHFTLPLLSRIYHAFDGDMVAAIVLGEIGHRNVAAWLMQSDRSEEPLGDADRYWTHMRPCNALSIAEACNIPRETVRRKVVALIKKGYIHRDEAGHLFVRPESLPAFEDMNATIIDELIRTAHRLERLLAGEPPTSSGR